MRRKQRKNNQKSSWNVWYCNGIMDSYECRDRKVLTLKISSYKGDKTKMFRKMRRFKQQVSDMECKKILTEEKRAAFSVIGDEGYPYTIPINFYYDEKDNCIYFHGAKEGHKIDAIKKCDKVCFSTWNQGFKKDGGGLYRHP